MASTKYKSLQINEKFLLEFFNKSILIWLCRKYEHKRFNHTDIEYAENIAENFILKNMKEQFFLLKFCMHMLSLCCISMQMNKIHNEIKVLNYGK